MQYKFDDGSVYEPTDGTGDISTGEGLQLKQVISPTPQEPGIISTAWQNIKNTFPTATTNPTDENGNLYNAAKGLASTYGVFSQQDTEQQAQNREAAQILNVPLTVLEQSPELRKQALQIAVQKANAPEDWVQFTQDNPATAQYLSNPTNMAIAHDSLNNMSSTEKIVKQFSNAREARMLEDRLAGILWKNRTAGLNTIDQYNDDDKAAIVRINNQLETLRQSTPQYSPGTLGYYVNPSSLAQIAGGIEPGLERGVERGAEGAIAGAGIGAILGEGVGAFPGAITGGGYGLREGLGEEMAQHDWGQAYYKNINKLDTSGNHMNPIAASASADLQGALAFGLGIWGGGVAEGTAKKIAGDAATVATTSEARQQFMNNAIKDLGHQMAIGGSMAAADYGIEHGTEQLSGQTFDHSQDPSFFEQTLHGALGMIPFSYLSIPGHTSTFIKQLNRLSSESKLLERSPSAFADHLSEVTNDTPAENMYISAPALTEYFQTVLPENPEKVQDIYNKLGVTDQLAEASQTGGDVQIPTSTFEAVLGKTKYADDLAEHVKFSEGDLTQGEIRQGLESRMRDMDEVAKAEPLNEEKPAPEQTNTIDTWREKLTDAGLNKGQVEQFASMFDAYSNTLEKRSGGKIKAEDVAKAIGIEKHEAPQQGIVSKVFNQIKEFFQPVNKDINPDQHVPIVDISKSVPEGIRSNAELTNHIKSLINSEPLSTADKKAVMNILPKNVRHIVFSSNKVGGKILDVRRGSLLSIKDLINNSHLIESMPNIKTDKKPNISAYHRFYVPVEMNGVKYVIRLVGEENKGDITLNPTSVNLYDAIVENKRTFNPAYPDAISKDTAGLMTGDKRPSTISIRDMLSGVKDSEGKKYFQDVRGSFTPSDGELGGLIKLFEHKNNSTVIHEAGHLFLDTLDKLSKMDDIPKEMKEDYQTIRDWLGANDGEELTVDQHEKFAKTFEAYMRDGKAPSTGLSRAFDKFKTWMTSVYKRIADLGVEVSPEVKGVFDRMLATDEQIKQAEEFQNMSNELGRKNPNLADFRQYMSLKSKAYQEAMNTVLKRKMAEMDPELKTEIEAAAEANRPSIEKEVRNNKVYPAIDKIVENNGGRSAKSLADEYLKNTLNTHQKAWVDMIAAAHGFKDGKELSKTIMKTRMTENEIAYRMEKFKEDYLKEKLGLDDHIDEAAKAMHNEHQLEAIALEGEILRKMAKEKFATPEEKAKQVKEQEAYAKKEKEANDRWREAELDFANKFHEAKNAEEINKLKEQYDALEKQHEEEISHTKKEAEYNLRWAEAEKWSEGQKNRLARQGELNFMAARQTAREMIANKPLFMQGNKRLEPNAFNWRRYTMLERQARSEANRLINKGEYEEAIKAKNQEMLNHALAMEAIKVEKEYKATMNRFQRFIRRGNNLLGIPVDFMSQIDTLLKNYGLTDRVPVIPEGKMEIENLHAFIDRIKGQDEYNDFAIPSSILNNKAKSYTQMSLNEFRDLKDAVNNINHMGRSIDRFLNNEYKETISEIGSKLHENVETKVGMLHAGESAPGTVKRTWMQKIIKQYNDSLDIFRQFSAPENICRLLDGGEENGIAQKYFFRPLYDSYQKATSRQKDMMQQIINLMKKNELNPIEIGNMFNDKRTFEVLPNHEISMGEVLSIALNWGNEGNRDRIRRWFADSKEMDFNDMNQRIIDNHVLKMISELQANHLHFVQDIWNHLESYWPEIRNHEIDLTGVDPKQVDATAFEVKSKDGQNINLKGGYYPISYDANKSADVFLKPEDLNALYKNNSTMRATTNNGHTKARAQSVTRPVSLDFKVLTNHLSNIIYDLEMRKTVIDSSRLLRNGDFKAGVTKSLGIKYYNMLDNYVKDVASDQRTTTKITDKIFDGVKSNFTKFTLGLNIKALPDFFPVNQLQSLWQAGYMPHPGESFKYALSAESRAEVQSKSEMMANRLHQVDYNIAQLSRAVLKDGWLDNNLPEVMAKKEILDNWMMSLHGMTDILTSYPTWNKIYERSLTEGHSESDAIGIADSMVRRTFGDGSKASLPEYMRNTDKLHQTMSMFLSWQLGHFNRMWYDAKRAGFEFNEGNYATGIGVLTKAAVMGWILPAMYGTFLHVGLPLTKAAIVGTGLVANNKPGVLDDKEKMKHYGVDLLKQPLSGLPIVGNLGDWAINTLLEGKSDYHMSPLESGFNDLGKEAVMIGKYYLSSGPKPDKEKVAEAGTKLGLLAAGLPQRLNTWMFNYYDWVNHHSDHESTTAVKDFFSRHRSK